MKWETFESGKIRRITLVPPSSLKAFTVVANFTIGRGKILFLIEFSNATNSELL